MHLNETKAPVLNFRSVWLRIMNQDGLSLLTRLHAIGPQQSSVMHGLGGRKIDSFHYICSLFITLYNSDGIKHENKNIFDSVVGWWGVGRYSAGLNGRDTGTA
jgi:hypothetical protein